MSIKIPHFINKYRKQISLALGMRLGYSAWLAVVWIIVDKWIPQTEKVIWETYYHLTPSSNLAGRALIDVWLRWDAVHWMNIAAFGYSGVGVSDTIAFPLYPFLVGILARVTSLNVTLIGILVSTSATLVALILLYELVLALFHDEKLANWTTILLAIYPTAIFLHAPYTEGLFLLWVSASILMMVKQRPLLAGLFACAAGMTRAQGTLLLLPMAAFYIQASLREKTWFKWREILAMIITPCGFLTFTVWRAKNSLPHLLEVYQERTSTAFQNPIITLATSIARILDQPTLIEITELVSILLFLGILIWMFINKEFRQHLPLWLYSAATWLLITSKTVSIASPMQSANRYVLHIFFAFVCMAMLLQKTSVKTRNWILMLSIILALVCATLYPLWIFIG